MERRASKKRHNSGIYLISQNVREMKDKRVLFTKMTSWRFNVIFNVSNFHFLTGSKESSTFINVNIYQSYKKLRP